MAEKHFMCEKSKKTCSQVSVTTHFWLQAFALFSCLEKAIGINQLHILKPWKLALVFFFSANSLL